MAKRRRLDVSAFVDDEAEHTDDEEVDGDGDGDGEDEVVGNDDEDG